MQRRLLVRKRTFELGERTLIMGVLNVTPDSFSGDGVYGDVEKAVSRAGQMIREGADIIDVGGESTRPGAQPVGVEEELKRVLPPLKRLLKENVAVSIDTYKPEVAAEALNLGAHIINDVTGLRDPRMAPIIADHGAGVIIMHMKGEPRTMQVSPSYPNGVVEEVRQFLKLQVAAAQAAGIRDEGIIVDPGIGFGKTADHNLEILRGLTSLRDLGKPILVGPSRKSFVEKLLGEPDTDRFGTAAAVVVSVMNGADIVRVHDVLQCRRAAVVADAISRGRKIS